MSDSEETPTNSGYTRSTRRRFKCRRLEYQRKCSAQRPTATCPIWSTQRPSKCRSSLAKMDKAFRKPTNKFARVGSYSLQRTTPQVCRRGHKRHLWHAMRHRHRLCHRYCTPHRSLRPSPKQRHGYLRFSANQARTRRKSRIPSPRCGDPNTGYLSYLGFQNLPLLWNPWI